MAKIETIYFVWIKSQGKFNPQKWHGLPINSATGKPQYSNDVIAFSRLLDADECCLTLEQLCQKYPYEEKGVDNEIFKINPR